MRSDQELDSVGESKIEKKFLTALNETLEGFDRSLYRDLPEDHPTIHVVGAPRSGTTILMQSIISTIDIGYISNLIACFWKAPVTGIRIAKKVSPDIRLSNFKSRFGRTDGAFEPHEFGYFWANHLKCTDLQEPEDTESLGIDWDTLRIVVTNMCKEFDKPVLFKSFVLQWYIGKFVRILPKSCFIRIRRDPIEIAESLLRVRLGMNGSVEEWASLKPKEYEFLRKRPFWEQVAGQVFFIERNLDRQLLAVDPKKRMEVSLPDLVNSPQLVMNDVAHFLRNNQVKVHAPIIASAAHDCRTAKTHDESLRAKIINAYEDFVRSYGE